MTGLATTCIELCVDDDINKSAARALIKRKKFMLLRKFLSLQPFAGLQMLEPQLIKSLCFSCLFL